MKVDIYNQSGKKITQKVELNSKVFSVKPNDHSIYLTIKSELAAKRQGNSHSKNRSEVRGGGTKPWKQKGTGRARVGSTRNPSRVHGGAAFGPQKRSYSVKLNKKTKLLARKSALSIKAKSNQLIVLDDLNIETSKTKDLLNVLSLLKINNEKLIILCEKGNKSIYLSSRNMMNVNTRCVESFSTCDIADSSFLLVDKTSIEYLNEKLN